MFNFSYFQQCFLKCLVDLQCIKKRISENLWWLVFYNLRFHILYSQYDQFSGFFVFLASIFIYHLFSARIILESRSFNKTFLRASEVWWKLTRPDFFLPENFFGSVLSCCKKGSRGDSFWYIYWMKIKWQGCQHVYSPYRSPSPPV